MKFYEYGFGKEHMICTVPVQHSSDMKCFANFVGFVVCVNKCCSSTKISKCGEPFECSCMFLNRSGEWISFSFVIFVVKLQGWLLSILE